ncbi:MAG TPA: BadF/BadG/BcrA/BcrD ATPase family protein [Bacilli bacterium]|nr:BadF/BadG/BcrA/BcrD ATPase family protein [Bacilli bacterium]
MKKLILGVDGGNSKTDFFLFDTDGNFLDFHRGPTCSHEQFKDSYQGAFNALKKNLDVFFFRNALKASEISAAVFGLAGVDTPVQKSNMEKVVADLGFANFKVVNDSFLPIKAATSKGYGVCSINGAGTSCGGIDSFGSYLQVGGIGSIVGDEAGGFYIARMAIRSCYDEQYRFGKPTTLSPIVMDLLKVTDKYYLMDAISAHLLARSIDYNALTLAVFSEAQKGDLVSQEILKQIGENLARSVSGCISNLDFIGTVEIVLAGSVWVKGASPLMYEAFQKKVLELTKRDIEIITLTAPPATGAIIWAMELASGEFPPAKLRQLIINNVLEQLNKQG